MLEYVWETPKMRDDIWEALMPGEHREVSDQESDW